MEDFLNTLNEAKKCYESFTFEDTYKLSKEEKRLQCIEHKVKLAKIVNSDQLLTSNLINERILILQEKQKNQSDSRRKFLDGI